MKRIFKKNKLQFIHTMPGEGDLHPQIYDHLDSVIILDTNGNILSYNHAFAQQYGYSEQDFTQPFFDVFIKYGTTKYKYLFERTLLGSTQKFNALGFCKNGKAIDINVTLVPGKTNAGPVVYTIVKNITEFNVQENELLRFQKQQDTFNELENICNYYYNIGDDRHYFSKQFPNIFGVTEESKFSPSLNQLLQYVHADDRNLVRETIEQAIHNQTGYQLEYRLYRKDHTVRYVYEHGEILVNKKGILDGLLGFIQDITDRKLATPETEKENQLTHLYSHPDIGIWSTNVQTGQCLNSSKAHEKISGYSKEDFNNGFLWTSIIHPEDVSQYWEGRKRLEAGNTIHHQYRIIHKDGSIKWVQEYTAPKFNTYGELIEIIGITSDITEQKELNETIKYLSDYDHLTKQPNRQKFYKKLQQLTTEYANTKKKFALMIFDMDRFKYINDTLGYHIGDELLVQIANRLADHLTDDDMLARHGGDEFTVLIAKMESKESLKKKVDQLIACLKEPFTINDFQLYVTASVGISTYPENGVDCLELLRNADLALYKSQKSGKNNYEIISHTNSIQSFKSFSIGRDLTKALKNNEMTLYYQPRVDIYSNKIISAEALIRWNHPEWGLISPHEFLTLAEENGVITEVDDWVFKEACQQIKKWKDEHLEIVPISINISAVHFMKPDWPSSVAHTIQETGIQPKDLEFEITESLLLDNRNTVRNTITTLRDLGIRIALDDFGTGYSSLAYLTQFPFDVIKIDKSFIRNMQQSERDMFIAKTIIYMAKGLQINVVAEGVETMQQLSILQNEKCDEIQGYLFSHPVPTNEFETLLQKKILQPIDPELKAMQNQRKESRLQFPYPLAADMKLISIAGRSLHLGKTNVLIEDISIGGLRYISPLRLPVRGDVLFQFTTEILEKPVELKGRIVWKEEINDDLLEYGIKFIMDENEQTELENLLDTFNELLTTSNALPPYRIVKEEHYQYFKQLNQN